MTEELRIIRDINEQLEKENEKLKAREKCPCLSDYSTCLAEDKWELAQREIKELKAQIEKMKAELHHRLVSPSHSDTDCLDKIAGLDRLWQFGEF